MIDIKSWQIENPSKPTGHGDKMKSFIPEVSHLNSKPIKRARHNNINPSNPAYWELQLLHQKQEKT